MHSLPVSMPGNPNKLIEAVSALVRAEYFFRCGPNCFQLAEAEAFEKAQRKLRRALTGTGDLAAAFAALGGVEMPDRGLNRSTNDV